MQDTKNDTWEPRLPSDEATIEAVVHDRTEGARTKCRSFRSIKWFAFVILVFLALDNALLRFYSPIGYLTGRWPWSSQLPGHHQVHHHRPVTEEQAREILLKKKPVVIDGHNDLPYLIRIFYGNQIYGNDFDFSNLPYHVDGSRLKDSNVLGTFWSVFVGCPSSDFDNEGNEFGDALYAEAVKETFQQVDLVKRLVEQNHDILSPATSTKDLHRWNEAINCWFTHRSDVDKCLFDKVFSRSYSPLRIQDEEFHITGPRGKVASMMGAEGLHQIGNSIANLRSLYNLGVRYMTLTHGCNNKYADSATPLAGPKWGGLSDDGRKIIKEMNRLGMLVDLSHVSSDVMRQVLMGDTTRAPVMFSHSSAYALCPHPRNVPDDVLHLVKENDGVVMINFYPQFVSCGPGKFPANATLSMVADHIEHIGKLIGWDHVGLGSDFDGIESVPTGLEDVSKFPDLTAELLHRGIKSVDVVKIMGLNILRVWRATENVAHEMAKEGVLPLEDNLPKKKWESVLSGGVGGV